MTAECTVVGPDGERLRVPLRDGISLLNVLIGAAITLVPAGCRGGGCGVCRVRVISGDYTCRRMSRRFVSEDDEREGVVLACRCYGEGDLVVQPSPHQTAS